MTVPEWLAASSAYMEANGGGRERTKGGTQLPATDLKRLAEELRVEKAREAKRGPDA